MDKNVPRDNRVALRRMPQARVILPLLAILAVAGVCLIYRALPGRESAANEQPLVTVSEATLEREYGMRINLLAVTAAGGMIDVRFKVLDSAKAARILGTDQPRLAVVAEDSHTVIQAPPDTKQNFTLTDGQVYFVQFPNSGHAVEAGSSVSLVLGNVRLEHLIAQ